ncbi:hypothetical protein niasHT_029523 [Heterodera trifolii]|uniref:Uncharacterized protein n=1 Tax=Heterodera trifolii TaxID=157864 RepID=A0ABD2JB31_9BILA
MGNATIAAGNGGKIAMDLATTGMRMKKPVGRKRRWWPAAAVEGRWKGEAKPAQPAKQGPGRGTSPTQWPTPSAAGLCIYVSVYVVLFLLFVHPPPPSPARPLHFPQFPAFWGRGQQQRPRGRRTFGQRLTESGQMGATASDDDVMHGWMGWETNSRAGEGEWRLKRGRSKRG